MFETIFILIAIAAYLGYQSYRKRVEAVGNMPGPHQLVSLHNPVAMFLPSWLAPHKHQFGWKNRSYNSIYAKFNSDVIAIVSMAEVNIFVADPELIHSITSQARLFPKPTHIYTALDLLGKNVVTSEGQEWKRHRKIASPSFSERNNRLVHEQTLVHLQAMVDDWRLQAKQNSEKSISFCTNETMMLLTALIISGAGMGLPLTWQQRYEPTGNHKLSLLKALEIVSQTALTRVLVPQAVISALPGHYWRELELGWTEFRQYCVELIQDARKRIHNNENVDDDPRNSDVLTALVRASIEEQRESSSSTAATLDESEIIGNVFVFLIAGHETTAHTLMFALAILALYPDIQQRLYAELSTILTDGRAPQYEDFNRLVYTQAVLYETLRLFPPVTIIPKMTGEDVEMNGYQVKKGCYVHLHVAAMHRNPKYWGADAESFRPERFLSSKTDANDSGKTRKAEDEGEDGESTGINVPKKYFLPFSLGMRSCLGKRFAQVESVCALAFLASRYKISLDLAKMGLEGKTREEVEEYVLDASTLLTLIPTNQVWLKLEERSLVQQSNPV